MKNRFLVDRFENHAVQDNSMPFQVGFDHHQNKPGSIHYHLLDDEIALAHRHDAFGLVEDKIKVSDDYHHQGQLFDPKVDLLDYFLEGGVKF